MGRAATATNAAPSTDSGRPGGDFGSRAFGEEREEHAVWTAVHTLKPAALRFTGPSTMTPAPTLSTTPPARSITTSLQAHGRRLLWCFLGDGRIKHGRPSQRCRAPHKSMMPCARQRRRGGTEPPGQILAHGLRRRQQSQPRAAPSWAPSLSAIAPHLGVSGASPSPAAPILDGAPTPTPIPGSLRTAAGMLPVLSEITSVVRRHTPRRLRRATSRARRWQTRNPSERSVAMSSDCPRLASRSTYGSRSTWGEHWRSWQARMSIAEGATCQDPGPDRAPLPATEPPTPRRPDHCDTPPTRALAPPQRPRSGPRLVSEAMRSVHVGLAGFAASTGLARAANAQGPPRTPLAGSLTATSRLASPCTHTSNHPQSTTCTANEQLRKLCVLCLLYAAWHSARQVSTL